ncbi:MAG TPA: GTP-binding protein, partial [Cellvibrio sp.]
KGYQGPVIIHGVQHIFHPAALLPEWPDEDRRTKLVFITYDTPREFIERSFDLFVAQEEKKLDTAPQPENM